MLKTGVFKVLYWAALLKMWINYVVQCSGMPITVNIIEQTVNIGPEQLLGEPC